MKKSKEPENFHVKDFDMNEETLRLFIEQSPVAIAMVDKNMRYMIASKRWLTDHGIDNIDIVGESHYTIFPETSEYWKGVHERCLDGSAESAEQAPFPRADGNVDWVRWKVQPWRDMQGSIGGIIIFSEIIADQKILQDGMIQKTIDRTNLLKESEDRFRRLAENAQDLIYRYELIPEPGFTYVSPSATTITGYTPEDHYADPQLGYKLVHPDDHHILDEAAQSQAGTPLVLRWVRKDGRVVWTEQRNVPILGDDGQVVALEGIARDITEQKQATEKILRQNEVLLALQKTSLELLSQLDINELLKNIVMRAGNLINTPSGYLDLVDQETGQLKPQIGLGVLTEALQHSVQPGEGVAGTVWQSGAPLIVNNYDEWRGRIESFSHNTLSAVIGVPLVSNDRVLGVLGLGHESKSQRLFEESDLEILTHFARLATIAIENARLYSEARKQLEERKRTESILQDREEKLRHIVEHSINMFYSHNIDHVLTYVSPQIMDLLGYTSEEALVKWTELTSDHPDNALGYASTQAAINTGVTQLPFELELIHKNSHRVWVEVRESPVVVDGKVVAIVGSLTDITDRKLSEDLIRTRLRLLEFSTSHTLDEILQETLDRVGELVSSPIGFYHFIENDEKTIFLQAWSTRTMNEYCKAEGKGLHYDLDQAGVWTDAVRERKPIIHNDYASPAHKKGMPEGHSPLVRELVVPIMRNDRIVAILGVGNKPQMYTEKDKEIVSYLADVAWEIAQRKRAEEQSARQEKVSKESRELLQNAEEIAQMGSWKWDLKTNKLTWSDGMFRLFGVDRETFQGDLTEIVASSIHPDDQEAVNASNQSVLVEQKPVPLEYRIILPDKSVRTVWAEGKLSHDDNGEAAALTGYVLDISERRMIEQAIEQRTEDLARSNAELEQFAYVASHDLQEPLRMVTNFMQLLERRYKGRLDTDADEFIHYAIDGARRMQSLINDLLNYSRVGTRGKKLAPISSEVIYRQVLENLKLAITDNHAKITHSTLPMVIGDEGQLAQLIQNLIGNAIKFRSETTPVIDISAKRVKGPLGEAMWEFSFQDNGIGIDPEYYDRIFVIFQRLHTKEIYPGTGMGLAICKKIVERHGGRIWVESQMGKGATFHFTLKAVD